MDTETDVVESVDSIDRNQWNNLVRNSPYGSVFHEYEWLESIEKGGLGRPRHLRIRKDGNPVAVFPNLVKSIGGSPVKIAKSIDPGLGGLVISRREEALVRRVLEDIDRIGDPFTIHHLVQAAAVDQGGFGEIFESYGYRPRSDSCRFVLALDGDWQGIKANFHKDKRYDIRKAVEQDYDVSQSSLKGNVLDRFYREYVAAMERVNGSTVPKGFLAGLHQHLPERTHVFTAEVEGEPVGDHLYVVDDQRGLVHHLYSAVPEENFEFYPSELIHKTAIEWAIDENYSMYDFGGTRFDFRDGIFKYKEQFGGRIVPTIAWKKNWSWVGTKGLNIASTIYNRLWKR